MHPHVKQKSQTIVWFGSTRYEGRIELQPVKIMAIRFSIGLEELVRFRFIRSSHAIQIIGSRVRASTAGGNIFAIGDQTHQKTGNLDRAFAIMPTS
jgi:hypothetical protein